MSDEPAKRPGKVVSINGGTIIDEHGVNEATVRAAEWLMKAALAGEIVGIAAAISYRDGGAGSKVAGDTGTVQILGALTRMTARLA